MTFDFHGLPFRFQCPSKDVLKAIGRIMRRPSDAAGPNVSTIDIQPPGDSASWAIAVDAQIVARLPGSADFAVVAEESIAAACAAAADRKPSILMRGAILEIDGAGLALIGRDLESANVLALHLHARHWTAVGFRHAFLDPHSLEITGLESLASVSSASIDHVPRKYRRAIESSNWYDAGHHLSFYAVDPFIVHASHSRTTRLASVIVIDGTVQAEPSMVETRENLNGLETHPMAHELRVGNLTLGSPIASCDAIERWFAAAPSAS